MELEPILISLGEKYPWILVPLAALGLLVVVGTAVVGLTATKKDDAFLEKLKAIPLVGQLIRALAAFSPVQPKPKAPEEGK